MKMPKIGTKSDLFGYFGLEFWKTIVIFKISTFELVQLKNFVKKQKCQILGPKITYLDIFDQICLLWVFLGKNFKKTVVIFVISTVKFCLSAKFHGKTKMPKFEPKMSDLCIFRLEFENNMVIFEISILEFTLLKDFAEKQKYLNLLPKIPYLGIFAKNAILGYFWADVSKMLLSFLKSAPSNLSNCKILWKNKNT